MTSSHPNAEKTQEASNSGGGAVTLSDDDVKLVERAIYEVKRVIVGQDQLVERILVGLLAKGHVLLEGVPGVAKTLAVETFAKVVGGSFSRVQFTPDLVPTDLIGTFHDHPDRSHWAGLARPVCELATSGDAAASALVAAAAGGVALVTALVLVLPRVVSDDPASTPPATGSTPPTTPASSASTPQGPRPPGRAGRAPRGR